MNGTYCLQLAWWLTCKCWYVERGVSFALFPTFTVGVIKASAFPLISMSFVLDTFWSFCSYWSWFPRSTSRPLCPRSTNRSLFPMGARWSNSSLFGVLHMLSWKRNTLMSKLRPRYFFAQKMPLHQFFFVLRKTWSPGKEVRWCHSQITQIYQMNYTPVLGPHSRTLNHRQHKIAYFKFLKGLKF